MRQAHFAGCAINPDATEMRKVAQSDGLEHVPSGTHDLLGD